MKKNFWTEQHTHTEEAQKGNKRDSEVRARWCNIRITIMTKGKKHLNEEMQQFFRTMTRKYLTFQIEKDNGLWVSINEKW